MPSVAVNRELLEWARERAGLTPGVLVRRVPGFAKWMAGKGLPTMRQLEELAKATLTPLGYFFLPKPPDEILPIPFFRTTGEEVSGKTSLNLLETVQVMQRRQAWMREFLIEQGQPALPFVGATGKQDEPAKVALDIRKALRMEEGWARKLPNWTAALDFFRNAVEEAGILVSMSGIVGNHTRRKLNPREFRGFVLIDDYAPLVFLNSVDWKSAQMFTLAHEVAHVWHAQSAAFDLRDLQPASDRVEQACNRIAAEFLVPEGEMRQNWPAFRRSDEPFQAVAAHFKVSAIVGARRALDLDLISRDQFFEFLKAYEVDERRHAAKKPSSGGNFFNNQNARLGRRFANAVVRAAHEGRLLYRDAYDLTGLHGATFEKFSGRLGFGSGR